MAKLVTRGVAGVALLLLSPILIAAAVAIWLEDGFPILFRQKRVGQFGSAFEILKFRSMRSEGGALITGQADSRITKVGRLLRKYKLDEFPQLWNVFRGDMDLIGPRPEIPFYVDASLSTWQEVLRVKPGITDLASLVFRNEETILARAKNIDVCYRERILPAKLALNIDYLRSRTWVSDLKLLVLTARYSFIPRGFNPAEVVRLVTGRPAGNLIDVSES